MTNMVMRGDFSMVKKSYNKSYKEIFQEHIDNEEGYKEIEGLYNYIKQDYMDKIKNGKIDIKIEKARLERDINQLKITSVPNYISFTILAVTVLVNGIITAYTQYKGSVNNCYYITTITIIFVIAIFVAGFSSSKEFAGEDKKVIVSKLCLRILDDIQNEIVEKQTREEEEKENTEKQKRIEGYINSRNSISSVMIPVAFEVAADILKKDSFIKRIFGKFKSKINT